MEYTKENDPNPGRLIESLRSLGYGNYQALADIVDNSIDAEASALSIKVGIRKGKPHIQVADNGIGMDKETLDQAMRLGSLTERDRKSDLGRFGMGLVTASLSIARRCTVLTRNNGTAFASAWDVDVIVKENRFLKHLAPASNDEVKLLDECVGTDHSGTIVLLDNCDNLKNRNLSVFAKLLAAHLGRVHRYFLKSRVEITINDRIVRVIDPLELDNEETKIDFDTEIPIKFKRDGQEVVEIVRARIALITKQEADERDIAAGQKNQGFYVMRNLREIMNASTLGFFTKHNDFNQMRGEIFFPATMDDLVGIEFTKRNIDMDQSVYDQLAAVLKPNCTRIKRMYALMGRVRMSARNKELHDQSIRSIEAKDKLLLKPKARIEKRSARTESNGAAIPRNTKATRTNFSRTQQLERRLKCKITEEKMGPNGQIYECDMQGRTLLIRYNIEHPFYQRFITENTSDGRIVSAVDFLIYSMAAAELRMVDEDKYEIVNTFKSELSSNLRTLLH